MATSKRTKTHALSKKRKAENMYVYHFKRKNMRGNELIPLNSLKSTMPEVFEEHVKKYKGREKLLGRKIPIIDCLWNDVLHLSPVNPQLILNIFHRDSLVPENRKGEIIEIYKIPIEKLSEENTVYFQSFNYDINNYSPDLEKFWKFSLNDYSELNDVPEKQIEIWHKDKEAGRVLFWYSHTPHILSKTTINISDCEVIECRYITD